MQFLFGKFRMSPLFSLYCRGAGVEIDAKKARGAAIEGIRKVACLIFFSKSIVRTQAD